jgi:hypothetical protein
VTPLTLSSPTKATPFRIILWRCCAVSEHGIARLGNVYSCSPRIRGLPVDDPSAWLERFLTEDDQKRERDRLHKIIEPMVPWEASTNEHATFSYWTVRAPIGRSISRTSPSEAPMATVLTATAPTGCARSMISSPLLFAMRS